MAKAKRVRPQDKRKRALDWLQKHSVGIVLVGLLLVMAGGAAWKILGRGSSSLSAPVDLDKSKGEANAPVMVMEFGDFQ